MSRDYRGNSTEREIPWGIRDSSDGEAKFRTFLGDSMKICVQ